MNVVDDWNEKENYKYLLFPSRERLSVIGADRNGTRRSSVTGDIRNVNNLSEISSRKYLEK